MNNINSKRFPDENLFKKKMFSDYLFDMFDIYSHEFPLYFKGKKKITTKLGLFSGIISIIIFIVYASFQLNDLFSKKKFSIIYSEYHQSSKMNLLYYPIFFSLIRNDNQSSIADYDFRLNINYRFSNESGIFNEKIKYNHCNETLLIENYSSLLMNYEKFNFTNYYCIDSTKEIYLQGRNGQLDSSILSIEFFLCLNETKYDNCASFESQSNNLYSGYVNLFFVEISYDNYNYSNPIFPSLKYEKIHFSNSLLKEFNFYFSKIEYISDNGLFFEHINRYEVYNLEKFSSDFSLENSFLGEKFGQINFYLLDKTTKIDRKYLKIPEIAANIQVIINIIYICTKALVKFITSTVIKIDIINTTIFNYQIKKRNLNFNIDINNNFPNIKISNNDIKVKNSNSNYQMNSVNKVINIENSEINLNSIYKFKNPINSIKNNDSNQKVIFVKFKLYQYFLPLFIQKNYPQVIIFQKYCYKIFKSISIETIYYNFQTLRLKFNT